MCANCGQSPCTCCPTLPVQSITPPTNPQFGQLWINNTDLPPTLEVWNGKQWELLSCNCAPTPPPGPEIGNVWADLSVTPPVLNVWNGTAWVPIGPATDSGWTPVPVTVFNVLQPVQVRQLGNIVYGMGSLLAPAGLLPNNNIQWGITPIPSNYAGASPTNIMILGGNTYASNGGQTLTPISITFNRSTGALSVNPGASPALSDIVYLNFWYPVN